MSLFPDMLVFCGCFYWRHLVQAPGDGGAAGFIASKVRELLLAQGRQVVGLDNLNDAYDARELAPLPWKTHDSLRSPAHRTHFLEVSG